MVQKARKIFDDGFVIGLVFALFLASKIVPFLVLVGVLPIFLFWRSADFKRAAAARYRLFAPVAIYFVYCIALLHLYPGLDRSEVPARNPGIELYAVAIALFALGFLRSLQIENLLARFQLIAPPSLFVAFLVLSAYMALGIDGCRVRVAAPWPFIPALIFTTLTLLLFLGWERKTRTQRYIRLLLVSLSVVVVLAYTGSRGVAVGQFAVLGGFVILRCVPSFRKGLPTIIETLGALALGVILSGLVGAASGCANFDRWQAVSGISADHPQTSTLGETAPAISASSSAGQPTQSHVSGLTNHVVGSSSDPQLSKDDAISIRLNMWVVSLDAIRQAPLFGHGALSLKTIIQDRFGFEHNHNQYLAWLVTGGVVSFAVGLLFMSIPALISKGLVPVDRVIMALAVTGLWGGAMMFDAFLSLKFYLHYYCLLLGFLFALVQSATRTETYGKPL